MHSVIKAIGGEKILILIVLLIVGLVLFLSVENKKNDVLDENVVYQNTISISRTYIALRLKTDKVLSEASTYPDYNTWDAEMTELLNNWKNLETKAGLLEKQADFKNVDKVSFNLVNTAHAYTKDEISNVFDKAPAGRKIRTLAKYLGVDAKRAYKILQNDQEFVKADAWNEAGDTFKKLEVSAIVIKDGCKVAGFIGAAAITGGATAGASLGSAGVGAGLLGGSATLAEGTIMIVTGTDLMLEIGEDAATISLGDNHKAVKAISNIRSVTDPAASILSLTDIPKNISKGADLLDKVGVVLVQIDQVRSMVQDGKLLGINITPDSKVEVAAIKEDEVEEWIGSELEELYEEEGYMDDLTEWLEGFENLDDWLDNVENEVELEEADREEEEFVDEEEEKVKIQAEEASEIGEENEYGEIKSEIDDKNNENDDKGQLIDDDTKVMEDGTVMEYANKMMKMRTEGLITEAEWQESLEIMKEMVRQESEGDEGVQNKSVEEQEVALIEASTNKHIQINKESPSLEEIFKMTEAERLAVEEARMAKQEARKARLKADCISLHGEGENAEMCYFRGKF